MDASQDAVHCVSAVRFRGLEHGIPGVIARFVHCTVMVVDAVPGGNDLDRVTGLQQVAVEKTLGAFCRRSDPTMHPTHWRALLRRR